MYQRRSASSFFIEWSKVYLVLLHLVCFLPVFSISGHRSRSECFVWWSLGKIKGFFFWATVSYPFCYQMIWCKEMLMHFGVIHCVNNVMILPVLELQFWLIFFFVCFFKFRLESVLWICLQSLVPLNVECISVSVLHWRLKSYEAIMDICGVNRHMIMKNLVSHGEL